MRIILFNRDIWDMYFCFREEKQRIDKYTFRNFPHWKFKHLTYIDK